MATAAAAALDADTLPALDVLARWRSAPRVGLIVGAAAAVAVLAALMLWARTPDWALLYSGVAGRTGGDIIAKLEQAQVPYQLTGGGSTILVPRDQVDRLRLQLAQQGLPKDGVGFELMDNTPFGTSEFAEKVKYQRALSGELARSIETIGAVAAARVQLALPEQTVFVRERQTPKASVVLTLRQGGALTGPQVGAIQHLVASAVPGLPADLVTLVDDHGRLLSREAGGDAQAQAEQLAWVARIEDAQRQRVQTLLAPIFGAANVQAQVNADVSFARRELTSEAYTPNSADKPQAIRSQKSKMERQGGSARLGPGGVPGALSNQPTPEVPSPINNPARGSAGNPPAGSAPATPAAGNTGLASQDAVTNYELDHTVTHVREPIGQLKRLSVAVLLNRGETPLPEAELAHVNELVRSAVGFVAARGDAVTVVQMPFVKADAAPAGSDGSWRDWLQDPLLISVVLPALKYLVVGLAAWLLWLRMLRPLVRRSGLFNDMEQLPPPVRASLPSAAAEQALADQRRQQHRQNVSGVQEIAKDDPRMVAMVVKNWIREEPAK